MLIGQSKQLCMLENLQNGLLLQTEAELTVDYELLSWLLTITFALLEYCLYASFQSR